VRWVSWCIVKFAVDGEAGGAKGMCSAAAEAAQLMLLLAVLLQIGGAVALRLSV